MQTREKTEKSDKPEKHGKVEKQAEKSNSWSDENAAESASPSQRTKIVKMEQLHIGNAEKSLSWERGRY